MARSRAVGNGEGRGSRRRGAGDLVPADADADRPLSCLENLEPGVPGREIELFLIAWRQPQAQELLTDYIQILGNTEKQSGPGPVGMCDLRYLPRTSPSESSITTVL